MVAITMPSTSLVDKLRVKYPQFRFQNASVSRWSPRDQTVYYHDARSHAGRAHLLHELGHAIAGHSSYNQDIELLHLEREAWQIASSIAPELGIAVNPDMIEDHLDTYREWLHNRSRCPACNHPGLQRLDLRYACVLCGLTWEANDARQCGLKRYTKTQT